MPDFKQMTLIKQIDPLDQHIPQEMACFTSERHLAAAAWSITQVGTLADLTEFEASLVENADDVSGAAIAQLVSAIRCGHDPLGDAFMRLRSASERRALGAVYTPQPIVDAMVSWVAAQEPLRVVDPGAGSGRFVLKAGQALPDAALVAIELDPLAALLTRANLTASGLDQRAQVIVGDYRKVRIGGCDGDSASNADGVTAFLANPPYVRHHQIEPHWKAWLKTTAKSRNLPASALSGLHMHFFFGDDAASQTGRCRCLRYFL